MKLILEQQASFVQLDTLKYGDCFTNQRGNTGFIIRHPGHGRFVVFPAIDNGLGYPMKDMVGKHHVVTKLGKLQIEE